MKNKFRGASLLLVLAVAAFAVSCGDDSTAPRQSNPYVKKDLSNKSDVLNNIEYAYNKRHFPTYDELLDDNFTFFYTDGDVGGSGGTPVQWGRDVEHQTTSGLLNPPPAGADKIDMKIDWTDADGNANVQWTEQVSGTETWYYTTVFYHFTIRIGDFTYIPTPDAKAQFTVRNAGTAEKPKWRLVEFHDLAGTSLAAMLAIATEPTTWGQVKALYR